MKTIALLNKKKEVRRICEVNEKNAERLVASKLAFYFDDNIEIKKAANFMDMRTGGGSIFSSGRRSKKNKENDE